MIVVNTSTRIKLSSQIEILKTCAIIDCFKIVSYSITSLDYSKLQIKT